MRVVGNTIYADEGKVIRRIESQEIFGTEVWLGKSYYINGIKQNPPHEDVPADFEEIDKPADYDEGENIPYYGEEISDTEALNIITGQS